MTFGARVRRVTAPAKMLAQGPLKCLSTEPYNVDSIYLFLISKLRLTGQGVTLRTPSPAAEGHDYCVSVWAGFPPNLEDFRIRRGCAL